MCAWTTPSCFLQLTFGEALLPLTSLKLLYLGIFLTPEELIENHVAHTQNARSAQTIGSLPDIQPAAIPSCVRCQTSKLLQQNSLENMQHQELVASLRVAQFVKSLEVIAWDSVCNIHSYERGRSAADSKRDADKQEVDEDRAGVDECSEPFDTQEPAGSPPASSPDLSADEDEDTPEATIHTGFKVRMRIIREAGRVRVERFDPLPGARGQAAFSVSEP